MIYLDTSVVVALLTPEERSAQALDWFGQSREPLISSDGLITEIRASACARVTPCIWRWRCTAAALIWPVSIAECSRLQLPSG